MGSFHASLINFCKLCGFNIMNGSKKKLLLLLFIHLGEHSKKNTKFWTYVQIVGR